MIKPGINNLSYQAINQQAIEYGSVRVYNLVNYYLTTLIKLFLDLGLIKVLLELNQSSNGSIKNKSKYLFTHVFRLIHRYLPKP